MTETYYLLSQTEHIIRCICWFMIGAGFVSCIVLAMYPIDKLYKLRKPKRSNKSKVKGSDEQP